MMDYELSRSPGAKRSAAPSLFLLVIGLFLFGSVAVAAENDGSSTGREIYERHCAACHGSGGTGAPDSTVGFQVPLPDFTDCDFATRETTYDWLLVAQKGGPARGFAPMMPAFGDAVRATDLRRAVEYVRGFCSNPEWPRGELNLPRPLVTTKAYPEDEVVLATEIITVDPDRVSNEFIYEQRFGTRNQFELVFPFGWSEQETADGSIDWTSSVGDIAVGVKRVMFHSRQTGSIFSLGGEVLFPTGDEKEGFGADTTRFEPYAAFGQLLPANLFVQLQAGYVQPFETDRADEEAFWRGAFGRMFYLGTYGRRWTPMVEVTGSKVFASGSDTLWDIVPQLQVALNRRQHVRLGAGAQIPVNETQRRENVYTAYLLWDWFDGGFFDGW